MNVGSRIKHLRKQMGLSAEELAKKVNVSPATIYRYESSEIMNMRTDKLIPIAEALNTTPAKLIMDNDTESTTPASNIMLVDDIPMQRIPIIGDIAAGTPIATNQEYDEYAFIPQGIRRVDFALRVNGDSMDPFFLDGDLVYIRQQDDVEDGQIAAVCLDDTATLKRVYHIPNGIQLISENRKYKPMTYTFDDCDSIRIIGLAVRFERNIE